MCFNFNNYIKECVEKSYSYTKLLTVKMILF